MTHHQSRVTRRRSTDTKYSAMWSACMCVTMLQIDFTAWRKHRRDGASESAAFAVVAQPMWRVPYRGQKPHRQSLGTPKASRADTHGQVRRLRPQSSPTLQPSPAKLHLHRPTSLRCNEQRTQNTRQQSPLHHAANGSSTERTVQERKQLRLRSLWTKCRRWMQYIVNHQFRLHTSARTLGTPPSQLLASTIDLPMRWIFLIELRRNCTSSCFNSSTRIAIGYKLSSAMSSTAVQRRQQSAWNLDLVTMQRDSPLRCTATDGTPTNMHVYLSPPCFLLRGARLCLAC